MKDYDEESSVRIEKRFGHLVNYGLTDPFCICPKGQIADNKRRKPNRKKWLLKIDCPVHARFL